MNTELRKAREKASLTQVEVAKKAGITERCYQYYESNEREPGVKTALLIAKALNTTIEKIFNTDIIPG